MQGPATISPPRRRFKHRRKVVVGILLLVLALGAWRFVLSPTYWRVATFPQYQGDYSYAVFYDGLAPCVDGFCLREGKFTFALRDWRRGREIWRVTSAEPYQHGWLRPVNAENSYGYAADVSPSGEVLAVMSAVGRQARVQSWQDGTLLGEVLIPTPLPATDYRLSYLMLWACDDGRCFLSLEFVPAGKTEPVTSLVFLARGNTLIADGTVSGSCRLAPDGSGAYLNAGSGASGFFRVMQSGRTLAFAKVKAVDWCLACPQETAVSHAGIIRADGRSTTFTKSWLPGDLCPSGAYVTLSQDNRLRNVHLATGRQWQVDIPSGYELYGGDPTEGGRHLLAYYQRRPNPLLLQLAERYSLLERLLYDNLYGGYQAAYIALYRHPQRRMAAMRIDPYYPCFWWPSPDGRTLVLGTDQGCRLMRYVGP
ncbi:MAG: hypothetical protein ACYDCO_02905 [Armatimonadota bacterium]